MSHQQGQHSLGNCVQMITRQQGERESEVVSCKDPAMKQAKGNSSRTCGTRWHSGDPVAERCFTILH